MVELSVSDATLPEVLAAVEQGHDVVLRNGKRCVAFVSRGQPAGSEPREPFTEWVARLREEYDWDANGLTQDEVDSWRDKSPGRESPF